MTEPVKRPYRSTLRQEQAAQTRARILDAAWSRFDTDGYGRTTIRQIAEGAGVAVDTVYATFGTKARVLTALIDRQLAPDSAATNVLERSDARSVHDEPDQRRQIHLFARSIAAISASVRPVYEVLRTASAVEPAMAAVHAEMDSYRLVNMRQVAEWLAATGPLRVEVDKAAEIIWALASPDVGRMLCEGRGWSDDEYADWLEDSLSRTLISDG